MLLVDMYKQPLNQGVGGDEHELVRRLFARLLPPL